MSRNARWAWAAMVGMLAACSGSDSDEVQRGDDGGTPTTGDGRADAGGADAGNEDSGNDPGLEDGGDDDDMSMDAAQDASPEPDETDMDATLADAEVEPPLPIDAGVGCEAPTDAPLTASQAGLPTTGLKLWLRGDRGVYKTASNEVCAWRDQTQAAWVFSPPSASDRPQWDATSVGGQEALHFDEIAERLQTPGVLGIPAQSARTFVVVQSVVNLSGRIYTLVQGQTTSNRAWVGVDVNTFMTKGNLEGVYVTDHSFDSDLPTATGARLHVLMVQDMEIGVEVLPRISYRVNSQTRTLTRNPGGLGNGTFEDFSGADFTFVGYGGSAGAEAYVAEALLYDHVLSAQELQQVEQTLSTRYGIAQPQQD